MKCVECHVEDVMAELFDRLPALMGFSVEAPEASSPNPRNAQLENELVLANVETFPWTGRPGELLGEIVLPLLELLDEEPEARELLRGRTFARRVH
jgi:hypothetical protein